VCKILGISVINAIWLSIFFIFGTIYAFLAFASITAFTVQTVGMMFVILAIYEYIRKGNMWLVGIYIACAGMTRPTLYLAVIFFIIELFYDCLSRIYWCLHKEVKENESKQSFEKIYH